MSEQDLVGLRCAVWLSVASGVWLTQPLDWNFAMGRFFSVATACRKKAMPLAHCERGHVLG